MLAAWIVAINATNVAMLYAMRVLCGLTLGVVHTVVLPMYLGEIGSAPVRGSICTIHGVMAKSGICFAFAIGPFVSLRLMNWLELLPISLFLLTFAWCPESPYWLLGHQRPDEALHSLQRLRGHRDVHAEFAEMELTIRRAAEHPIRFADIGRTANRGGLMVTLGLAAAIVLTGTEAMLSFAQIIFAEVGTPLSPSVASLLTGGVLMATTFVAAATVDRLGRRPLLLGSTVGLLMCNATLTGYFVLMRWGGCDMTAIRWLPVVAVMAFVVSYGMGLATVAFALIGEILPKDMKAVAGIVFGLVVSVLSMVVSKAFQVLGDGAGYWVIYAVFTISSAALLPFVWFCVPETKGKTVNEILELMATAPTSAK